MNQTVLRDAVSLIGERHQIRVEMRETVLPELSKLLDGRFDLATSDATLAAATPNLATEALAEFDLGVHMAADHPLASREYVSLADLADQHVLFPPRKMLPALYDQMVSDFRAAGVEPRFALQHVASRSMIDAVVASSPDVVKLATWPPSAGVVVRPLRPALRRGYVLAWHLDRGSKAIDALRDAVRELRARQEAG